MRRFKALTMGKPCIMGRKTWESLPKKPLPGRTNIVVTRDPAYAAAGAVVVHSFEEALAKAKKENPAEIMAIGGAEIFAAALPLAARIYLTEIHAALEGDVHFPSFAPQQWRETTRQDCFSDNPAHSYVTLDRKLP
jgi:dihydrofolate reductase